MNTPRGSLRRRVAALCAVLTVAALTVTGFDSYQREHATLRRDVEQQLHTLARMVALNSRSGVEFDSREDVHGFLQTVVTTMNVLAVAVYMQDGTRFALAGDDSLLPERALVVDYIDGDPVASSLMPYRDARGDGRLGRVLVRASGDPIDERMSAYLRGLVGTDLLALAGLWLGAYWLLRRLLKPIAALVETTHRVRTTEDYSLRAQDANDDEVGALVRAFNAMLEAIQGRDANLADNADRLEQQVRQRTAELSRAVQAAESSTRAKSTFVANMSHEIRTPLNAILGMTELALEAEDPAELREYLGVIRSAGSNLLGVLCDILDLSKIESDKLELSIVPTDLESLAMDALRPLTSRIQSKDLELSLAFDPRLSAGYRVDDVRLRQILTNLVGNAIKFTAEGSVDVQVRLCADRGAVHDVEIVVQDTGVGIPDDRLQAIFQPFTQADSTITRRYSGTGLGLHITERLARLMDGTIRVESKVGRGSTFVVTLPLEHCGSPVPALPAVPAGTRLLLVTSSPSLRGSVGSIAARAGLDLLAVERVADLPTGSGMRPHDVVLFDDRDPDNDAALCTRLTPDARGVRPALILAAFQDLASASARCRANTFAGYLTKPVSRRELVIRIATLHTAVGDSCPVPEPGSTRAGAPIRTLRILVAEDNAVNQRLIERILARDGHDVTIAANGRVCCELFAPAKFDVVLMDMQMPEMSGLEATTAIRRMEQETGMRVPIVALTANTTAEDRRACLDAGMDEVLPKPVSIPKLRATLALFAGHVAHSPSTAEATSP